ncbi:hypothetical protein GCM10027586_00790 [Kineococcus gypseus]|uniref:minor capsid protein n=1 Tax=Kineococcus gypseus TaxID=1637102 RepID=UPI003D7E2FE8
MSTLAVLTDLAVLLAEHGVATYRASGVYSADEVGVRFYEAGQAPDRVVVLTPYPVTDDVVTAVSVLGVQVRCRGPLGGDPRDAQARDEAVFDLLHGAQHLHLGGLHVATIARRSAIPMGPDASGRWEASSSYHLTLDRPTLWRTS